MGKYKVCSRCKIAFDAGLNSCPSCGRPVEEDKPKPQREGDGRRFRAGGEACDYCPHCYGNADWCPVMGD